jgi:hypothetical protein
MELLVVRLLVELHLVLQWVKNSKVRTSKNMSSSDLSDPIGKSKKFLYSCRVKIQGEKRYRVRFNNSTDLVHVVCPREPNRAVGVQLSKGREQFLALVF